MTIEAMKQALEALEKAHPKPYNESVISHVEAITALRTAIAEAEKQTPVAYLCENAVGHKYFRWKKPSSTYKPIPLYTTPPAAQPAERKAGCTLCGYCAATGERVVKADTRNGLIDNDFEENT